jgi:hypothetical protein
VAEGRNETIRWVSTIFMPPKEQELSSPTRQTWKNPRSSKATHRRQVAKPKELRQTISPNANFTGLAKIGPSKTNVSNSTILAAGDRISHLPARGMNNANTRHVRRLSAAGPDLHGEGRRDVLDGQGDSKPAAGSIRSRRLSRPSPRWLIQPEKQAFCLPTWPKVASSRAMRGRIGYRLPHHDAHREF